MSKESRDARASYLAIVIVCIASIFFFGYLDFLIPVTISELGPKDIFYGLT